MSINYRGYVMEEEQPSDFDEEGNPSFAREAREALVADLAKKWSVAHHRWEQYSFRSEEAHDAWCQHLADLCENAVYAREQELGRKLTGGEEEKLCEEVEERAHANSHEGKLRREVELIEAQLDLLGARMMRPYEHHGEDERYMEYMETRYDNSEHW